MHSGGKSDNWSVYFLSQSTVIVVAWFVGSGSIFSLVLHYIYFLLVSCHAAQDIQRQKKISFVHFSNFTKIFLCFWLWKCKIFYHKCRGKQSVSMSSLIFRKIMWDNVSCILIHSNYVLVIAKYFFHPSFPFCSWFFSQCPIKIYKYIIGFNYHWNMH